MPSGNDLFGRLATASRALPGSSDTSAPGSLLCLSIQPGYNYTRTAVSGWSEWRGEGRGDCVSLPWPGIGVGEVCAHGEHDVIAVRHVSQPLACLDKLLDALVYIHLFQAQVVLHDQWRVLHSAKPWVAGAA